MNPDPIQNILDQITDRMERLVTTNVELQHQNLTLLNEIKELHLERDSLNSRLRAARARIDVLVCQLEQNAKLDKLKDK
jgi:cell division protein ZapB